MCAGNLSWPCPVFPGFFGWDLVSRKFRIPLKPEFPVAPAVIAAQASEPREQREYPKTSTGLSGGERELCLQPARRAVRVEHQDAEDANDDQIDADHPE